MSQHDYDIADQTAPNVRSDLNLALKALASTSSGATAPATTYANMLWYDAANNLLKKRNEANSGWITLGTLNDTTSTFTPTLGDNLVDEDDMASNSATKVPSQQSVKAYVDASVTTPAVLATISAATLGDIGTYAFLRPLMSTQIVAGMEYAGANLRYSGVNSDSNGNVNLTTGATPAGTWMAVGSTNSGTWANGQATMFLRVS